ncbi:MAG: pilus assembly protein [Planctomycetes bacterium]|nr:pilus assembly protein [Planctomycetota bacterium]
MALTSEPGDEPRGLAALRHLLVDDEGGSAAVEFIVLIPVYVILLAGLFSMSQLMLVRQRVVMAARYEAWSPGHGHDPEAMRSAFFRFRTGEWKSTPDEPVDLDLKLGGSERGRELADLVLENKVEGPDHAGHPLRKVKVKGAFEWSGLVFLLTGVQLSVRTDSAVVLTNDHKRPMFQDGMSDEHPMVGAVALSNLRQDGAFDPIGKGLSPNPYRSPVFGTFREGGADPGLWSRDARLGGNVMAEHGIYRQKMGQ